MKKEKEVRKFLERVKDEEKSYKEMLDNLTDDDFEKMDIEEIIVKYSMLGMYQGMLLMGQFLFDEHGTEIKQHKD